MQPEPVIGGPAPQHDSERQLTVLMYRYEAPLFRFLTVLLRDRDAASDCTQDTFVRAYEHLQRGRPVTSSWLYTVGRNRARDELRRRARSRRPRNLESRISASEPDEAAWIREAFAGLPPQDRAILYLLAVEGWSAEEIGRTLRLRTGTVYTRLSRARKRLRQRLGDDDART